MSCRNACTCRNETYWTPCTDEPTCYNGCAASPCAYAILSKCRWEKGDDTAFLHKVTVLWRDCLFNGEYSARIGCDGDLSDFESGGDFVNPMDFGCAQLTNNCDDCGWPPEVRATSGRVWHLLINGMPPGSYPDPPDPPPGATLVLNTVSCDGFGVVTETPIAAYVATDDWDCLGRNTMIFHGCYDSPCDDLTKYLPREICVVPYASNWEHPCGIDSPDLCPCEDPGCPNIAIDVTIECATPVSGTVVLARETDGCVATSLSLDLCGDIDWPDNDCGAFVGMLDNSCDLNLKQYWFVLWCESGTWTLDTYCVLIDDTGSPATLTSVTLIDSQELTRINVCEEVFVESGIGVGDYLDEMFEPVTITPDPDDEGCCEVCAPEPICTQWTVQFVEGSNGNYVLGTGGQVIGFFVPDETRNWTIGATLVAGSDASSGQIHADHADCCNATLLDSFSVATDATVALTADQIYIICFFNAVGTNTYSIEIT